MARVERDVEIVSPPEVVDRIGDVSRKELSLNTANVTRKRAYQRLSEGLDATVTKQEVDDHGDPVTTTYPDMIVRHKYLETALKLFGDLKDKQEIEMSHRMEDSDRQLLMKYGVIAKDVKG